jgi:hypothetical protein
MKKSSLLFKIFITTLLLIPATVFADAPADASSAAATPQPELTSWPVAEPQPLQTPQTAPAPVKCTFAITGNPDFKGKFLSIKIPEGIQPGQIFTMRIFVQNTGNIPWFSEGSGCNSIAIVHLGTEKDRDRASPFYTALPNPDASITNSWISPARIKMDNLRVSPLQIGSFTITAKAPDQAGIYREFYAPVAEGVSWMEGEALFSVDINVGNASLNPDTADYVTYIQQSTNLSELNLTGGKNITVSLTKQLMYVRIGDTLIRTFPVSTGTLKDPTPPGKYNIFLKQMVRVAGSVPHYIMPLFMEFRKGGYGIHALPSLGNDHGIFWREALNHIGSARSHGCIRLLPQDAQFMWAFTDLGTPMTVQW